jgi:hypothetical protein
MTPSFGWLVALAASYPWLLAGDLLGDLLAPWHLLVFVPGLLLATPVLRLGTWQAMVFAACIGLAFESRRPLPPGSAAFVLMALAALLQANRSMLVRRRAPLVAAGVNLVACAAILPLAALDHPVNDWSTWAWGWPIQATFAGLLGAILHPWVGAVQSALLERAGFPEVSER